ALALIEEECNRFRPTKNYLAHLPTPKFDEFETEVMKNEFERIQNRQPMEMLNMKRYDLNPPPAGKMTDVGAWQEAVINSQAQLEHQALRVANMDLMAEYGAEAWKVYNEILQRMLNQAQSQLNLVRKEIQEVNFDRKQKQMAAGEKLKKLEEREKFLATGLRVLLYFLKLTVTILERLEEQLRNETYECMICCEKIRRRDFIWSCQQCFHVFHLKCVKKWAKSSTTNNENASETPNLGWRCPACQNINRNAENLESFCFCLREILIYQNKGASSFRTPHSCGKMCKRSRESITGCPHPCPLLCHPGPCPPCPKIVEKFCVCGSSSKHVRCGTEDFKCKKKCEEILNCEVHICTLICHNGQCPNCDQTVETICHCGKNSRTDPCSFETPKFACGEPCGKRLSCGNHFCSQICHAGACPTCFFSPQVTKTCPCGKKDLQSLSDIRRQSCLDQWLTCGELCGKILRCGPEGDEIILEF
uniref:Pre-mRNA-splicing factor SPF27 n=1 Tax=Romanomermis culicivorax TaxID=13658 RepID=A0A915IB80_ROMCU